MSIQDDIDALAAMAMTCFNNHRFGMSEKTTIYLNQLDFNTTQHYYREPLERRSVALYE
jgi:hypothetical protein